jgi:hypothetical protein
MPRFAANLSMLYNEHAFLDRFAAAAADGFDAVEYLFPYEHPAAELAARLRAHGLQQVLFNAPPGDWAAGERGLACLPGRQDEFRRGVARALEYAQALGCPRIHLMAGLAPDGADRAELQATYVDNLAWDEAPDHRRCRFRGRAAGAHPAGARHAGRPAISQLVIADQAAAPADLLADARVQGRVGKLLAHCQGLRDEAFDGVFHLASAVSGECEADFELGLRIPTSTARARCWTPCATAPSRGRDADQAGVQQFGRGLRARPGGALAGHRGRRHAAHAADQLRHAQADLRTPDRRLHAQGLHRRPRRAADDGDGAPGRPNGAASSFFSGIIREPLAGEESVCPVSPRVAPGVGAAPRSTG